MNIDILDLLFLIMTDKIIIAPYTVAYNSASFAANHFCPGSFEMFMKLVTYFYVPNHKPISASIVEMIMEDPDFPTIPMSYHENCARDEDFPTAKEIGIVLPMYACESTWEVNPLKDNDKV